jgi:hypothetical protein
LFSQFFESAKVFCARFEELRVAEARIVSNKLVNVKNMIFSFIIIFESTKYKRILKTLYSRKLENILGTG